MTITPEQAKAELLRRKNSLLNTTPEQARAELERRKTGNAKISKNDSDEENWVQLNKRGLARGAKDALAGTFGLLDVVSAPIREGANFAFKKSGSDYRFKPMRQNINEGIDQATAGYTKPRNRSERITSAIIQELGDMPASAGLGLLAKGLSGATALARHLKGMAGIVAEPAKLNTANIASNVGSTAALQDYIESNENPSALGAFGSSLLGGITGRTLGSGSAKLTSDVIKHGFKEGPQQSVLEGIGKSLSFSPQKYKAQTDLGIPVSAGSVSEVTMPAYAELVLSKWPGAMGTYRKYYKNKEMALARNLGISEEDLAEVVKNPAYHLAKKGANKYDDKVSNAFAQKQKIFAPREAKALANKETIDVSNLVSNLEHERSLHLTDAKKLDWDKTADGKLLSDLKRGFAPTLHLTKNQIDNFKKMGYDNDFIDKIQGKEPKIGLKHLNELREKALTESKALKSPVGENTAESLAASERHKNLSKLRLSFIETHGTAEQAKAAKSARKLWAIYKDKEEGLAKYVARITGSETDEKAFDLLRSDPKALRVVRRGLPAHDQPKLLETFMTDLGKNQGRFNIATAYTQYSRLDPSVQKELLKTIKNPQTKNLFVKTMDIIGDQKRELAQLYNSSHTAHTQNVIDLIKKYGAGVAALATGYGLGQLVPLAFGHALVVVGAKGFTNQKLLSAIDKAMVAKSPKVQTRLIDNIFKEIRTASDRTSRRLGLQD